ncbi:MAG: hypothetical protein HXM94_06210 [Parvimonas micra]|uniref:Uncharacterized protein n=1 Tax=Parvimonas micra TaxID=33033 RepID=A0A930E1H2_9FIRM|nr:hypothetical protein [Parvimonas micra]MBF1307353.1 hypothetical protein [Parvimonas micra]
MTKEERAEKWFKNIPNSENINMEKKVEICNVVARWTAIIFIGLVIIEFVLLSMVNNGSILNYFADTLNGMSKDLHGIGQYKTLAIAGMAFSLPLIILPLIVAITFKNKYIKSKAENNLYRK